MAAFDFPSSPNVNDIYTLNGVAFMWNGSVWKRYSTSTGAQGFQGAAGAAGAQGTAGVLGGDGAQGAVGAQGATGSGATGAQGAAGATGAQGAAGAQGAPFDRSEYNYTASGGQTAFAAAYANASDVDVFMNGVRLTPAEYTPSGGTTITLASGATAGDIIDILTFASAGPTGAQGAQGHQGDAFNRSESNFTATSGQTSFAPAGGYTNGDDLDVFVNGVRLTPADYTATNGTNVVLDVGANTGDIVDIIYYEAAGPAGAQGAAGIAGTVTFSTGAPSNPINGDLWYDTDDGAFAGYYDDGSTSQWIDLSGGPRGAQGVTGAQGAAGSIPSNITAVSGTFSGDVSIAGTLTYEDVTNIDSVGVITARAGIHITSGGFILNQQRSDTHASLIIDKPDAGTGTLKFFNNGSASAYIQHTNSEHLNYYLPSGSGYHAFYTNNTERLRIASDGDIEYKYDDADTDAEIGSTQLPHGLRIYNTNNTLGRLAGIHFSHGSAGTANAGIFHETTNTASGSTTCLGDLVFYTKNSGVSYMTEKLRITSGGNVRIGSTAGGTQPLCIAKSDSSGANLQFQNSTTGNAGNNGVLIGLSGGEDGQFWNYESNNLLFGTNNIERMRITSAGRMGVGNNSPGALLEVRDSNTPTQGNAQIRISKGFGNGAAPTSASRANCYLHLGGPEYNPSAGFYSIGFGYTNNEVGSGIPAYIGFKETTAAGYTLGDLVFGTRGNTTGTNNPTEQMRIDSDGVITMPNQPAFHAKGGSALANNTNTIIIGSGTEFNRGNHYSTSNGRFTAPVDGIYQFSFWGLLYPHASGVVNIFYSKNGTQYGHLVQGGADSNSHTSRSGTVIMNMSAGDYAELRVNRGSGAGGANAYGSQWNMCGHLIG